MYGVFVKCVICPCYPSNREERLRMRVAVLAENVKSCELECKASRETVQRLMAELDQEKKKTASSLAVGRRGVETEKRTLSESLEASRRVIEAARREPCCLEKRVEECRSKAQAAELKLQRFLEKVAGLLQEKTEHEFLPTERDVLHHLDSFCNKLAEQQVQDLRRQLQSLETERLEAELHRDELRRSNRQYEEFVERLSETMKVDGIDPDLGVDMRLKLVRLTGGCSGGEQNADIRLKAEGKVPKGPTGQKRTPRPAFEEEGVRAGKEEEELICAVCRTKRRSSGGPESQTVQEQKLKMDLLLDGKAKAEKKLSAVSSDLQGQEKKTRGARAARRPQSRPGSALLDFQSKVSQTPDPNSTSLSLSNDELIQLLEELLHSNHHHHHTTTWHCSTHHSLPLLPDLPEGRSTSDDSVSGSPFAAI
ncbi:hypothetical protein CCH79_00007916 [Gambusia affinis]|uniref:Uncharacterized protein n=1 Tax=Gambusia affinis TaxID=33528 RepID=A0A315W1H3_GAMAF|nr:hypothetical protein CCH79_00007916 [Gambusia affinis]